MRCLGISNYIECSCAGHLNQIGCLFIVGTLYIANDEKYITILSQYLHVLICVVTH